MACTPQSLFYSLSFTFFGAQVAHAVISSKFLIRSFCLSSYRWDGEMDNILQTIGSQKSNLKKKPSAKNEDSVFFVVAQHCGAKCQGKFPLDNVFHM